MNASRLQEAPPASRLGEAPTSGWLNVAEGASSRTQTRPASQRGEKRISSSSTQKNQPIPKELLERIAEDILDHSKQLGLFDEMRMKLLKSIESSKNFHKIKKEFNTEVRELCQKADLSLSRAKLRDKLNTKNLAHSASKVREHVQQISREHKQDIRQLYRNHAVEFIASKNKQTGEEEQSNQEQPRPTQPETDLEQPDQHEQMPTSEDPEIDTEIREATEAPVKSMSASSSSTSSRADSFADSGVASVTPPSQSTTPKANGSSNAGAMPNHLLPMVLQSIMITDPEVLSEIPLPPTPTPPDSPENKPLASGTSVAQVENIPDHPFGTMIESADHKVQPISSPTCTRPKRKAGDDSSPGKHQQPIGSRGNRCAQCRLDKESCGCRVAAHRGYPSFRSSESPSLRSGRRRRSWRVKQVEKSKCNNSAAQQRGSQATRVR